VLVGLLAAPSLVLAGSVSLEGGDLRYAGYPSDALFVSIRVIDGMYGPGGYPACGPERPITCIDVQSGGVGGTYSSPDAGPGCRLVTIYGPSHPAVACPGPIASIAVSLGDGNGPVGADVDAPGRDVSVAAAAAAGSDRFLIREAAAVGVDAGAGDDHVFVTAGGTSASGAVRADGGPGDDDLEVQGEASVTVLGGDGDDHIIGQGTSGAILLDGGAGNDFLESRVTKTTRDLAVVGGDGDDVFKILPSRGRPVDGAGRVSCGGGRDRINDNFIGDQLRVDAARLGQHLGPVTRGLRLSHADCPPAPRSFPYETTVRLGAGRTIRMPLRFGEAVRLRIKLGNIPRPQRFSARLPARGGRIALRLTRRTITFLRRVARRHTACLGFGVTATDADGEQWHYNGAESNDLCVRFHSAPGAAHRGARRS
jgi:hypothetical protein